MNNSVHNEDCIVHDVFCFWMYFNVNKLSFKSRSKCLYVRLIIYLWTLVMNVNLIHDVSMQFYEHNKVTDNFFLSQQVWCVLRCWADESVKAGETLRRQKQTDCLPQVREEAFKNTDKAQAVNKLNKRRWIAPQPRAIKGSTHCQWGKRSQEERKQEWIRVHSSNEETIICHYTPLYQKPRRADHMDPHVGGMCVCLEISACEDAYVVLDKNV